MAKSPIVLPLSTTFLQRFSQHFSTDGGRKPIGRRTRMVAHLGGALVSARLCRLPEQEVHQQSKSCTLCECVKTTMNEESAVLCPVRASSSFDITPRVSASEIVSFSMLRRSFVAGILAVAVSASTTATIVLAAFMIEEYFFSLGSSGSSILSSTEFTTLITALQ